MLDSLLQILPVFLIIIYGVVLDAFRVVPRQTGELIGAYVLFAALPLLLVHILAGSSPADMMHGGYWAGIVGSLLGVYVLSYATGFLLGGRSHGAAAVTAVGGSCANMAFLGLPVILNLFPDNREALVAAGLALITPNLVCIICQVQLEYLKQSSDRGGGALPTLARALFLNPLVAGAALGFVLGGTGLGLWEPLDKAAKMVGDTSAPCMLLALGLDLRSKVRMALSGERKFNTPWLVSVAVIKLVIHPLLAWALLAACGVTGTWLAVGVIMSGTASALLTYVMAQIYGHLPEEAAMATVLTNVLNLVTLTILASIFRWQGLL
ncbi:AEC family transporter [Desulfocurvus sp. DL9XJH121]